MSRVENELEILSEKTDNEMKITETIKMTDLNFRVSEIMDHVKSAIKIFRLLLDQGEISKREQAFLYGEYLETEVQEVLSCFREFNAKLLNL